MTSSARVRFSNASQTSAILRIVGLVVLIFGSTMLLPVVTALALGEPSISAFAQAALLTASAGGITWFSTRHSSAELQARDGFLLVTLTWCLLPFFAALPLLLFMPTLSITDAYFETSSAMTTTGATVLIGLDKLPLSINLWRCFLQWLGGMGLIVLAVAILPLLGIGGRQIFNAETPGPFKESRLTPRIEDTAKALWYVYAGLTAACALCYWFGGMSGFDALIHSFTTLSLGGFSSHDASFAHFNSPALESIAIVFMLVAGVNFSTHFIAWRGKFVKPYLTDPEARWFVAVTLASAVLVAAVLLLYQTYPSFLAALRFSLFNVVSIATTTGYASADYAVWPIFAPTLMLFLCLFASSAGSTGGGIKMIRARLAFQQVWRELVRIAHPHAVVPIKVGRSVVSPGLMASVLTFVIVYSAVIVLLTLTLVASGLSLPTAASAVVACISNTGPGLNEVGPAANYAVLNDFQTWVCTVAMLIGRLEIFGVLVVFTKAYWTR
jgi:trk system potassium uptake protein TrkH